MKLYHSHQSRSVRPRWLLEELGEPYELARIDLSSKPADYRNVHPHMQVPALLDGDVTIIESGAICAYLADKFPAKRMAPAPGDPARGRYYQWMFYTIGTLEPPLVSIFLNTIALPEDKRSPAVVEEARGKFTEARQVLSAALANRPFLLGEQITGADVMIGSTLVWAQMMGLLGDAAPLQEYVGRLAARPAFQKAHAD